jgi:hypothetical protein
MISRKTLKLIVVALTVVALVLTSVAIAFADPLQIGVTIDPTSTVASPTGVVTLTGTVTCDVPVGVSLSGQLTQSVGRKTLLYGNFYGFVQCTGGTTPWSVMVTAQNGRFGGGHAQAFVSAYGCTFSYYSYECSYAQASATIKLRGGK